MILTRVVSTMNWGRIGDHTKTHQVRQLAVGETLTVGVGRPTFAELTRFQISFKRFSVGPPTNGRGHGHRTTQAKPLTSQSI